MGTVPAEPEPQEDSEPSGQDDEDPGRRGPSARTATLIAAITAVGSILTPIAVALIEKL